MIGISRDEWMSALGEADAPNDPHALTMTELCGLLKLSRSSTRARVAQLVEQGKATRVFKCITDGAGRRARVPAYKLIAPKKSKR